ncbi:MAG TPA: UvrD-helicase domain-containing protein [Burkholderiales bacterium]|nr:UvrD-helicase domain-containing protein [Burkholderiales bacterium]
MIADQESRERALDPKRSFIVQAPAGSGKTDLLVKRYIKLLGTVEKPEEILAITFTIKAAAEMRQRVLKELNAPEIAHRLRIQTIDAFCVALTRQMPVLSGFGAQPAIVEDAREHYREAASRVLNDLSPEVARLLAHVDNNIQTATGLIAAMLAKRDQWLRKTGTAPTRQELESAFLSERKRLLKIARALHPKSSPEWAAEKLTKGFTWRKADAEAQTLSANEELRGALAALLCMPPERYTDAQWEVLDSIIRLLPFAVAQLKVVFAERGEADFTEFAQAAVRALGTPESPTDLLLAFDARIRHILVDEFQDTSISQWELLERLTAGWEMGDEKRGSDRTLFVVGDPMQSIYRFREAEVALFLHARRAGLANVKLEPLTLTTNFRSQGKLVDFFNAAFPRIFPAQADESLGAVPYSPATPHHASLPGDAVTWHNLVDRQSEAKKVVEVIRSAEGRSAILVRKRDALADIVPALKAEGIRYRAIEIEHLGEKQVVQDLYALTRALSHLGDRIAWLSILRAPWLALPLEKLFEIASADRYKTIWELVKDDLFLERFTRILAPAIANRSRGSLRERVEGVWLALGGPACVEDATDLEDAEIFLDELEKLEHAGTIADPGALARSLEDLYALPDVAAGEDDLQIMTIHKAKGLEFDTVIVPGLDKGPGRSDPPLFLWKQRPDGSLLLAPIRETGADKDAAYEYLKDLDCEAEDTESSRLLYVAATRAEKCLHLLACLPPDEHGDPKQPLARSLLSRAWPAAEEHFAAATEPMQVNETRRAPMPVTLKRLAHDIQLPPPLSSARWKAPAEDRVAEEEIEFSWAGETARHVGTVVHRWLQRMADDELRGWDARRIESSKKLFGRELHRRGVAPAELEQSTELVATALKNTLSDERGRWVLGPHREARSEYRLRVRTNAGPRTYVMDRVFRDKDGTRWIVDYKTSRHEGTGVEKFLDRERERYTSQLESYGAALKESRQGLYFPLLRGWRPSDF